MQIIQNINIVFIIVVLLYIWRLSVGSNEGFIGEVGALIDICIVSFLVVDIITLVDSFIDKEFLSGVTAIVVFVVITILRKIIRLIFGSLKWLAKLPLLNALNRTLGLVAGALEATVIVWVFYSFIPNINMLIPNNTILSQIDRNTFLYYLYTHNELGTLVNMATHLFA